jgi:hypothetical protein
MTDFRQVKGNNGTARVRPNATLSLIYLATQAGVYECEIELTPTQARELGILLLSTCYKVEVM